MVDRRRFLLSLGALAAAPAFSDSASYPFSLGVASGYPSPAGVVLWTRLTGDLGPLAIPVRWEVASDESMQKIISHGEMNADPEWVHSVHVEIQGLEPERWCGPRGGCAVCSRNFSRERLAAFPYRSDEWTITPAPVKRFIG